MSDGCRHEATWFDRSLCACGVMHTYCEDCGLAVDGCDYDPLQDGELEDEDSFDGWDLDVILHMQDPPGEAYETSWRRAQDILNEAGPESAILLLTVAMEGEDLASKVVLSSGYQRIPTSYLIEILNAHLGDV